MKTRTKQLIAAGAVLALILLGTRFFPRSLDKAVWRGKEDPKHIAILRYDSYAPPAVWITLDTERSTLLLKELGKLNARYVGPFAPPEAESAGYTLRLDGTDYGEWDVAGQNRFVMAGESGTLSVSWGDGKKALYRLGQGRQALFDLCDSYLDPEGGYPGLAFLQEFFSVKRDGRWSIWEAALFSSYSGAMAEAIEPYHEGLAPYVTAEILKRIELGRYLSRMELSCMAEARDWEILMIRMDEQSVPGSYNFWVDLRSTEEPFAYKSFSGSYVVNKEGLVSNFFIDLEE